MTCYASGMSESAYKTKWIQIQCTWLELLGESFRLSGKKFLLSLYEMFDFHTLGFPAGVFMPQTTVSKNTIIFHNNFRPHFLYTYQSTASFWTF